MPAKKSLLVPDAVAKLIRRLHPDIKRKIKTALTEVIASPDSAGKALRDELQGMRSYRVGRFRIVYRARGKSVEIVAIGPRKSIYEETYRLMKKEGQI